MRVLGGWRGIRRLFELVRGLTPVNSSNKALRPPRQLAPRKPNARLRSAFNPDAPHSTYNANPPRRC
jgi:hypothetical protein